MSGSMTLKGLVNKPSSIALDYTEIQVNSRILSQATILSKIKGELKKKIAICFPIPLFHFCILNFKLMLKTEKKKTIRLKDCNYAAYFGKIGLSTNNGSVRMDQLGRFVKPKAAYASRYHS